MLKRWLKRPVGWLVSGYVIVLLVIGVAYWNRLLSSGQALAVAESVALVLIALGAFLTPSHE